jgi:phosphoglycerate dehydrogenase-like enzyme
MTGATPIVLFIDRSVDPAPYAAAFAGELSVRDAVGAGERDRVVGLVTAVDPIGAEQAAAYPNLRLVLTCSTGVDHLDVAALRSRGLMVCHTPTYCTAEVADHALACVLAGWRGLWRLGEGVRAGGWDAAAMGRRVDAQRLGIIGLGRIGSALARRALPLGIDVVGTDPVATAPPGVQTVSLPELLATADAVSLHVPGEPGAPALLGAAEVAAMKPGALLVNLARASLVDLDAVLAALRAGALSGVAWDVWPQEPPDPADARLRTPGLLVTPHVAWSSPEADAACRVEALETLRAGLIRDVEPAGLVR